MFQNKRNKLRYELQIRLNKERKYEELNISEVFLQGTEYVTPKSIGVLK